MKLPVQYVEKVKYIKDLNVGEYGTISYSSILLDENLNLYVKNDSECYNWTYTFLPRLIKESNGWFIIFPDEPKLRPRKLGEWEDIKDYSEITRFKIDNKPMEDNHEQIIKIRDKIQEAINQSIGDSVNVELETEDIEKVYEILTSVKESK